MSDDALPMDWAADVKRYAPHADDAVIAGIVRYCGIALRSRDGSLVSFDDPGEIGQVRDNFCRKKLGLTHSDAELDAAIVHVGERMGAGNSGNRVTVCYLLAEHFGKLGLFGASSGEAGVPLAAAAPVAPLAMAAMSPSQSGAHGGQASQPKDDFAGFAALVFAGAATVMIVTAILGSFVGGRFDAQPAPAPSPAVATPPPAPAPATTPTPTPLPEGSGIVAEVIAGRPKVSVYFDVGKADIAPEFAAAVAPIKAWLEAHPDDRVQLSGFTDPTGNAAANAELAKRRAQAVAAALNDKGVAAERMDLVRPEQSSDAASDLAGARRVEITVTGS